MQKDTTMLDIEDNSNDKRLSVQLAPTEVSILAAASQIYSAFIISGKTNQDNEAKYMQKAIKQAMKMSTAIDESVKAEDEI